MLTIERIHRNTLLTISIILVLTAIVIAPVSADAKNYKLKIGCLESPDGPNTLGWKTFEQYVESTSNGQIDVDIYPSGQLGDSEKLFEGLKLGIHKMAQGDESITGAYDPMMIWFTPYLFSNELVMKKFFESETFEELSNMMAKDMGVRVLGAAPYGFYNFINKKQPINRIEDLKGLKLRTLPNSQLTIKTWEALGASATPVSWAEIYTAIKTGVIHGLGHTLTIMVDQRYYEVAKNVTLDMSMGCANLYLINDRFYQSLPKDLRKVVKEGAQMAAAAEFGIATYRNRVVSIDTLKKNGVNVVSLSADERARLKKSAHDAVIPWIREKVGEEMAAKAFKTISEIEAGM
ncbi:MAG: TRAP transporter substrate-binding protein [Desulfobacterium sp.]